MQRIIVIGIGTEVGKTVVSTILTEALDGHYWKPVQCGQPRDSAWVEERLTQRGRCYPEGIYLQTPCSPHLAARKEGVRIKARDIIPPVCVKPLVIEGTGGILAPLNENEVWFDAALRWNASHWILVHRHYLGSLNQFLLTVAFLQEKSIPLAGVIFNGEGDLETEEMLLEKAATHCLGRLPWQTDLSPQSIQKIAKAWRPVLGL